LEYVDFRAHLSGQIFMSTYDAWQALGPKQES
jgi:hypothetical protein